MVAMTSAILGPPRFGLVPMACAWHSEMEQGTYTEQSLAGDMKSLDFLASCGIDWVSDSHPWGGETAKMNALGADDKYEPGPLVRKFLDHAQKVGVKVVMWSSMNKTHPWLEEGRPFRADKPEWLLKPGASVDAPGAPKWLKTAKGNCLANTALLRLARADQPGRHGHRLLQVVGHGRRLLRRRRLVHERHSRGLPVGPARPPAGRLQLCLPAGPGSADRQRAQALSGDLHFHVPATHGPGRLVAAECRCVFHPSRIGHGQRNLAAGDQIRTWSRVRVQRDFFPHYLDQPLLFPSRGEVPASPATGRARTSTTSCSARFPVRPTSSTTCPPRAASPSRDKAEIRKWLDWGRKNEDYLKVRKDLPDWPAAGKVDGSAHLVGDRGLIFLFNPNKGDCAASLHSPGRASA